MLKQWTDSISEVITARGQEREKTEKGQLGVYLGEIKEEGNYLPIGLTSVIGNIWNKSSS